MPFNMSGTLSLNAFEYRGYPFSSHLRAIILTSLFAHGSLWVNLHTSASGHEYEASEIDLSCHVITTDGFTL